MAATSSRVAGTSHTVTKWYSLAAMGGAYPATVLPEGVSGSGEVGANEGADADRVDRRAHHEQDGAREHCQVERVGRGLLDGWPTTAGCPPAAG